MYPGVSTRGLSSPRLTSSAQNLGRRREVVGGTSPEFFPAWVINQGFPEDQSDRTNPAASSARASAGWDEGLDTQAPLSPKWDVGGGRALAAPARQPRLIRAGRSRRRRPAAGEKGAGRRGRRLPVGARTKPQLRLLCPFQTAFVPITSGPAAIWAEAVRSAQGPQPSLACPLSVGCGSPPSRRSPKFAAAYLSPNFWEEWNEWVLKSNWRPFVLAVAQTDPKPRLQTSPIWTYFWVWRGKGGGRQGASRTCPGD